MKALRIIAIIVGIFVLLLFAAGAYVKFALPVTDPSPDIKVARSAERIENGRYLANHVTICMDCHSKRDWGRYAGPMSATGIGAGGEVFNHQMGFPGTFYARNITPAALGSWSDGDIFRAVTAGVSKDGSALFPLMASQRFGRMDKEDIYDIIAYIRTLKPVTKHVPLSEPDFPVNFIINTMPQKPQFSKKPKPSDTLHYGAYLVNAAGCVECHSKTEKGSVIKGTEFGGGMEFKQPAGVLRSPNITFDPATGISSWTKQDFVKRFKAYAAADYQAAPVARNEINTPMPWSMYGGMKEKDLEAIYTYLKHVTPIRNRVLRITPIGEIKSTP
jgi:mono/diheme cytochrome c family protein